MEEGERRFKSSLFLIKDYCIIYKQVNELGSPGARCIGAFLMILS